MSAQLMTAGLYPPVDDQIWNPSIRWQPVPVWPEMFDVSDVTSGDVCPKFDSLQKEAYKKAFYELYLPNKQFMDFLKNVTGQRFRNIRRIKYIYDALHIQQEHGFEVPDWATKRFRAKLAAISTEQYKIHVAGLPEMIRLTAGPVLKRIVNEFESLSKRKMVLLVAHDQTIFTVAQALGFPDFEMPQASSHLIFEVHGLAKNTSDSLQVLYFRNSSVATPVRIFMPICRHPCPLNEFIDAAKRFIPDDWERECELQSSSVNVVKRSMETIILLFVFTLLISF